MLHSFLKLLMVTAFPSAGFAEVVSYICKAEKFCCQSICLFSWDVPNLLTSFDFVFNLLTSSFSLWCEIQWVSWKNEWCHVSWLPCNTEYFHYLKKDPVYLTFKFPPQNPGNKGFLTVALILPFPEYHIIWSIQPTSLSDCQPPLRSTFFSPIYVFS